LGKLALKLSPEAREAKRAYYRAYVEKNREKINGYNRKWNRNNPDKAQKYRIEYWERKANKERND
jgi:hypothetical protein